MHGVVRLFGMIPKIRLLSVSADDPQSVETSALVSPGGSGVAGACWPKQDGENAPESKPLKTISEENLR